MTKEELTNEYFDWMYEHVISKEYIPRANTLYVKLLKRLYEIPFGYILAMDANREDDGIELRYRFGYDRDYPDWLIAKFLDDSPCSVLEMMVALAMRCEESIMTNPRYGDRTSKWFWDMLASLELDEQSNANYNERYVNERIEIFLERKYERNGHGGLFTVNSKKKYDLRTVDIWYQAMWYLKEKMEE